MQKKNLQKMSLEFKTQHSEIEMRFLRNCLFFKDLALFLSMGDICLIFKFLCIGPSVTKNH